MKPYNTDNVFYQIIHNTLPSNIIYEDSYFIAIHDLFPRARVHVLVLPKKNYVDFEDFSQNASDAERLALFDAVRKVTYAQGVNDSGYKFLSNIGKDSGQDVFHLHFHIMGGGKIDPLV